MVMCQQQGEDYLHMVQLMPLPCYHLLLHENSDWFNLSVAGLTSLSWKKRTLNRCLSICHFSNAYGVTRETSE